MHQSKSFLWTILSLLSSLSSYHPGFCSHILWEIWISKYPSISMTLCPSLPLSVTHKHIFIWDFSELGETKCFEFISISIALILASIHNSLGPWFTSIHIHIICEKRLAHWHLFCCRLKRSLIMYLQIVQLLALRYPRHFFALFDTGSSFIKLSS